MDEDVEQGHPVHNPSDGHVRRHSDLRSMFQGVRVAGRIVRARTLTRRSGSGTGTDGGTSIRADCRGGDDRSGGVCDDDDDDDDVHLRTVQQKLLVQVATRLAHRQQLFGRRGPAVSVLRQAVPVGGHVGKPQAGAHQGKTVYVRAVRQAVPDQGQPVGAQAGA